MEEIVLVPGGSISGRCTVCRDVTNHLILTIPEKKPMRVQCGSCKDEHNYKVPPPSKAERDRVAAERLKKKTLAADCEQWAELRPSMIEAKAKDYSMDGLFKKKDLIKHPLFGLGLVQRRTGSRKIEILFEDGCKVMRCQ